MESERVVQVVSRLCCHRPGWMVDMASMVLFPQFDCIQGVGAKSEVLGVAIGVKFASLMFLGGFHLWKLSFLFYLWCAPFLN